MCCPDKAALLRSFQAEYAPFTRMRSEDEILSSDGSVFPEGEAFTGKGRLVRRATGCELQMLKPHYPASGSRAARAERAATVGAYQRPTDHASARAHSCASAIIVHCGFTPALSGKMLPSQIRRL